jgi:VIT1/CCC1 family predicted Fe2+/Mn2+ transporter
MIKIILTVVLSIILLFILSIFVTKLDNGEYKNIFSNKIIQKFTGFSILLVMIALIIKFKLLTGVLGMTLTSIGFILVTYLVWKLFIK